MAYVRARFTSVPALAQYLAVSPETVRQWIRRGILRASRAQSRHYTDDRPRKTDRAGRLRIFELDLLDFLAFYHSRPRPPRPPEALWNR